MMIKSKSADNLLQEILSNSALYPGTKLINKRKPGSGKKVETNQSLDSDDDIISTLPDNITEYILTLMPIRDALRTTVLAKKWRYTWRGMPKLVFTDKMIPHCFIWRPSEKLKLFKAIFHVLRLHYNPAILKFDCWVSPCDMHSEYSMIISYLENENKVKELVICNYDSVYKLPVSFFSLQGLELIHLANCTFEQPLTFNGFSRLKSMTFSDVEVSAQMLYRFLSKCPLLEHITLFGKNIEADFEGNKFTFVDLFECIPLVRSLAVSMFSMKYLCAGEMPHKLPTSLVHLEYLYLDMCMAEQNEISSLLCMIRSSPSLVDLHIRMYDNDEELVRQTPNNFLDPKHHSGIKLDHLERVKIEGFSKLPLEKVFLKLVMANSPVLKEARIEFAESVSYIDKLNILKDLLLLPFPRASPSAKLFIRT